MMVLGFKTLAFNFADPLSSKLLFVLLEIGSTLYLSQKVEFALRNVGIEMNILYYFLLSFLTVNNLKCFQKQ